MAMMVEYMVAAAIVLSYLKLLRFADFALVRVSGIYWLGGRASPSQCRGGRLTSSAWDSG